VRQPPRNRAGCGGVPGRGPRVRKLLDAGTTVGLLAAISLLHPVPWAADACHRGETFARLLRDRPGLAVLLGSQDTIRVWTAAELTGEATGLEVIWEPAEPKSGRAAEHEYPPGKENVVVVRISARQPPLDQLAGLVYELHNARRHEVFEKIHEQALQGAIEKTEYVRRILEQEFDAFVETREFLSRELLGIPVVERESSPLLSGILHGASSLDAHLRTYESMGRDLREHFERLYDEEIAPRVRTHPAASRRRAPGPPGRWRSLDGSR
jgi:hypothetical protein